MQSTAQTIEQYIAELPPDRAEVIQKLHDRIINNLPKGFEAGMSYGMIGYYVPLSLYPAGYHVSKGKLPLPFINLASQKNNIALYHMGLYGEKNLRAWFEAEYAKTSQKLDMGGSCIRFKKLDSIPYDLIGELSAKLTPAEYIDHYESALASRKK